MSGNATLLDLRTEAKDRADMSGSNLVLDPMWNKYINKSKDALYDLLISAYGADYYVKDPPYTYNLVANQDKYPLPADYYKTIKVEFVVDAYNFFPLHRFSPSTQNKYARMIPTSFARMNYSYREMGDNMFFYPVPASANSVRLWYVPLATNLVSDSDSLHGFSGWEEYIIIDAAMKALRKEESDTADLERDFAKITKRLEEMAETRNLGEAHKILDVARTTNVEAYFGEWYGN